MILTDYNSNFGLGGDGNGLMIDLKNLNDFKMDTTTWHASFGSGFLLGDLDKQLHANGKRAMSHGTCPGVGIGGHATIVHLPCALHYLHARIIY